MPETLTAARQYLKAGFSLIPIKADGSKSPALSEWKSFQAQHPTEAQLKHWFGPNTPRGIGLVWGTISGHGEALDFDAAGLLYAPFVALCHEQGLGALLDAMPLVETPTGGRHLLYRCSGPVSGNQKLAQRQTENGLLTLIETRGEGGYTLAPGSHPACHPAQKPYSFLRGGPDTLPVLTPDDRHTLLALAATFTQHIERSRVVDAPRPRPSEATVGLRPGDDYNERGDWQALVERHGWQMLGSAGDRGLWQRPGKTGQGISATSNYAGSKLFYVFSSNAAPFEPLRAYSSFGLFALLEHGGDFPAAAGQLAKEGYGQTFVYSLGNTMPIQEAAKPVLLPRPAPRKPIADRIIDLADVAAPGDLPLLFGPYLLQGNAHWLTGQTGLGKSTLLYNIACALAEGTPLWGIDCEPTRVLYCDMESGDVGRAHKVERLYKGSPRVRGQLLFLREPVKLPDEMEELLAFVSAHSIQLVVFDTARRCFSVRDENDNAEVYNRIIPTLDALKHLGVASLTLGHPSKNGNGSARGAGAQEDAGDVNLSLTMHTGDVNSPDGVVAVRVTKNRLLGLGVPPLFLRRIGEDQFERVDGGEGVAMATAGENAGKREQCKTALIEFLQDRPQGHASHSDLMKAMKDLGFSEATARRAKKDMVEEEQLLRATSGGYCLPSDPFADLEIETAQAQVSA